MGIFRAQTPLAPEALANLEGVLQSSFHPVNPNQEFVSKLRRRLVEPPRTVLEKRNGILGLLVVGAGLLTGAVILIFGKRSIAFILIGLLAIILPRLKKEEPQEQVIELR